MIVRSEMTSPTRSIIAAIPWGPGILSPKTGARQAWKKLIRGPKGSAPPAHGRLYVGVSPTMSVHIRNTPMYKFFRYGLRFLSNARHSVSRFSM
jgi:hypothetical protein